MPKGLQNTAKRQQSSTKNLPIFFLDLFSNLPKKLGVYTPNQLAAAGFEYTGDGDTAICKDCKLEISNWTLEMKPIVIHLEQRPDCPFVINFSKALSSLVLNTTSTNTTISNNQENPSRRIKAESTYWDFSSNTLFEVSSLTEVRRRTFSHWSHRTIPSSEQMIEAGFFNCNMGDRVICLCCNLICQQWTSHTDDPWEVHKTLSPNCIYVKAKLIRPSASSILIINENSFLERARPNESRNGSTSVNHNTTTNGRPSLVLDESTLSRLVAARLDLPISQRLLKENFSPSIIKKCWEDQLRLKQDDFVSDYDLYIACLILQKQIEHSNVEEIRNWKEDRQITRSREESLLSWSHERPSPIQMLKGGWFFDKAKGNDYARCVHCKSEHSNWQPADDPFNIHRDLAPNCPFIFATQPLHQNSVPIKSLGDIYTSEEIQTELTNGNPRILLPSSSNKSVVDRINSFGGFRPELSDNMIDALTSSGFFYTGIGTLIQCYMCSLPVTNFHRYSVDRINREHCKANSNCRYAKFMVESDNLPAPDPDSRCHWCFDGSKELVIFRCLHFAVCRSCAEWISVCSTCGRLAEAFFRVYC